MKARQAASGRRAHQMWSVEMCPWRTFFSRREWAGDLLQGKGHLYQPLAPFAHGHSPAAAAGSAAARRSVAVMRYSITLSFAGTPLPMGS